MSKQDDDGKSKRSKSRTSKKGAVPASHKSPEQSEAASAGVLSAASNRRSRIKDEKTLKALKWNFKTPTEDHINQLLEYFTANGKPKFAKMLFSKDFNLHIKALDQISNVSYSII